MLKHYNLNKQYVENLYNIADESIVSELSTGDKTLSFTLRGRPDIQCEEYIQTEDQRYIVKEITPDDDDTVEYTCQLDLEPLEGSVFEIFTAADKTVTEAANLALAGTGWRVNTSITKKRAVQCMKKTPLEILYLIRDAFMCEIRFDSINKIVYFAEQIGQDRGVYFRKDLNLKSVSVRTDSYDYCTRIIPIGKDDLRIDNDGKEYVENYQYSNKIRTIIWEDSSYEDSDDLQTDAQAKLEDLSKPKKSYSADIRDLAKLSADYSILSFGIGDTVWIVDEGKGVKEKQRIVKITEYPHDPEKNKCELSNTTLTWEEMQKQLQAAADAWTDVTNKDGSINGVHVYGISDGNKVIIQAEVNNNSTVKANSAGVAANAAAINGVVQDLTAVTARIGTVEATYLKATDAAITYATIDFANIDTANINTAKIKDLFTEVGLIRDAVISDAKITGYLDAVKINAASIDAGTLSVDRLVIRGDNTSLVYAINNISGALQSQNVNTINGEVLTDRTILADKIVAGSITANEIAGNTITADKLKVLTLSAIAADLGNITAGSLNIGNGKFVVTSAGVLSATGATISGTLTAGANSKIGPWNISANALWYGSAESYGTAGNLYFGTQGISLGSAFKVNAAGTLTATDGRIGPWNISSVGIYNGDSYLYPDSILIKHNTDSSYITSDVVMVSNNTNTTSIYADNIMFSNLPSGTNYRNAIYSLDGITLDKDATISGGISLDTIGSSAANHQDALQFYFNYNKASIPRNKLLAFYDACSNNGSMTFGYFLDGHDSAPYGGFFSAHYDKAYYTGISNGTYTQQQLITTSNYSTWVVPKTGGTFTGSLVIGGGLTVTGGSIHASGYNIVASNTGDVFNYAQNNTSKCFIACRSEPNGTHGIYSNGYYNGSSHTSSGQYLIYRSTSNNTIIPTKLYTHNEGYTTNRPVVGTNEGTNAVGVVVSNASSFGIYGRWAGGATAAMSGRTISCPSSDIRLKENIRDSEVDALSVIDSIRMRQFDWKDKSRGHWDCGMVVDEMERDIDPKFSIGGEDDEEGNPSYKSVDTFYLQGYEVKAIQELHAEIRALKGQLEELKSKIA